MLDRRQFCVGLIGLGVAHKVARPKTTPTKTVFYASVGPQLSLYQVDDHKLALARDSTVELPAAMQYAWPTRQGNFCTVLTATGLARIEVISTAFRRFVSIRAQDDCNRSVDAST